MSKGKAFRYAEVFEAWGTEVDSHSGAVASPKKRRHDISRLLCAVVSRPRLSKTIMEKAVGLMIHPFMHCRPLMALLSHSYRFINVRSSSRVPQRVSDELVGSILLLPLSYTNIRYPFASRILATDATPTQCGSCWAKAPQKVSRDLFSAAERKGENSRLDWTAADIANFPCDLVEAGKELSALVRALPWVSPHSFKPESTAHINIQEARAFGHELVRHAGRRIEYCRMLSVNDSRVCVGAFGKGRSSSISLNRELL